MRHFRLWLAIAGLIVLSACGGVTSGGGGNTNPAAPMPTDSISGTVMFREAPLAGVTVTAWDSNWNTIHQVTTTDANGSYTFSGLQAYGNVPTDYHVWVNKAGYGFYPSVGPGAKVTRADHTGQFQGNSLTDIGIYFTIIEYLALPNASLAGANFTAYDGSNPLVRLAETGQQASFVGGDDGAERKGVAWPGTRFTDNQDGTVTDNLTGLIWLRNAGCFNPTVWAVALADINQLASGACGLTDHSSAGQWRLPNLNELESMVDVSASNPVVPAGSPFVNVSTGIYWSSTSYFGGQAGSPSAWAIRFSDGRFMNDSASDLKASANNAVWAVKGAGGGAAKLPATGMYVIFAGGDDGSVRAGAPLTYPRFVDNGNGTVTDTVTGLVWLKQADCINQPWATAIASVNLLASGQCGLTDNSAPGDWRMPNRNEMLSLSDRMENNHADFFNQTYMNRDGTLYRAPIFTHFMVSQYYWTSTTDATHTNEAWTVFSCDFGVYDISKSNTGYTMALR